MNTKKATSFYKINMVDINVKKPQKNKIIPLIYNNDELVFKTPYFKMPNDGFQKTKFPDISQLSIEFENKTKINKFLKFIDELEEHISKLIIDNGSKWFTQKNIILRSFIKNFNDNKTGIMLPVNNNECLIHDTDDNSMYYDDIDKTDLIKFIIKVPHLWINNNQFGLVVIIDKILVKHTIVPQDVEYIFGTDSESHSEYSDKISSIFADPEFSIKKSINNNSDKITLTKSVYDTTLKNNANISVSLIKHKKTKKDKLSEEFNFD